VWNVATHGLVGLALIGPSAVLASAFSPDGNYVAFGSADARVRLSSVTDLRQITDTLIGHRSSVRALAFSPDGNLLASGCSDKSVRVWGFGSTYTSGEHLF
jgi:WD40 repeat protein